jgi:hypothetical protein
MSIMAYYAVHSDINIHISCKLVYGLRQKRLSCQRLSSVLGGSTKETFVLNGVNQIK